MSAKTKTFAITMSINGGRIALKCTLTNYNDDIVTSVKLDYDAENSYENGIFNDGENVFDGYICDGVIKGQLDRAFIFQKQYIYDKIKEVVSNEF